MSGLKSIVISYNLVKGLNVPEVLCCFLLELADFEADLELCFPLDGAVAKGGHL